VRLAKLLGDPLARLDDAIEAWRSIETDFGEADDTALALAALLRSRQRWAELGALLERRAGVAADAGVRAELLQQLGDVQRERLDARGSAVQTYARSLAADPRNVGARAGLLALAGEDEHRTAAVDLLLGALRTCDDWKAQLELTEHRLLAASTREEKLAVLLETAEIAERRAGDAGLAFEAVRRAMGISPGDPRVRAELARLAEATGSWQALVDTYRRAIEGEARDESALVADLWHTAGKVLEDRLKDAQLALEAYRHVVSLAASVEAGCAAVRVAASLGQWDVAAQVVIELARARAVASPEALMAFEGAADRSGGWDDAARAMAQAIPDEGLVPVAARDLHARLAAWHRDRRVDADSAIAAYRRALGHDEANASLLSDLAQLERRGRGRPLVETLTRLSRATGGDTALLREAAEVARDALGDRKLARGILNDLLDLTRTRWLDAISGTTPGGAGEAPAIAEWATEGLAQLHEQDDDPAGVVEVLVAGDAMPFELSVRRGMRRRAARIALDRLGDAERGIALYSALFDDDPHDTEAVDRLGATYASLGRTRDLLRLRERQIEAAGSATERLALRLEAASLHDRLGEGESALGTLRASLTEDPRHEATVEALATLLEQQNGLKQLQELLAGQAQLCEAAGDTARAAGLWARAATLAEVRLNEIDIAAGYHARVVALEPRAESFDALARIAERNGDHVVAAGWLEKLLEVVDAERRGASVLRLADALIEAGESVRAAERLAEWIGRVSDAEPLRSRLGGLYREQGEWAKLAALVADGAAHAPDKASRMARLLEAARLYSQKCSDPGNAVPLLEQASDLAPDDQSVRLALADVLAWARRFDEARVMLQGLINAFGGRRPKERAPVHYQVARLELAMGNRASALVELDTATRIDPQNPDILLALAELARDDGQLDRAEKSYRALLAVLRRREDTETPTIARSEVLLELSAIAERDGEQGRAREILESAIEAAAQNAFEQERLENALRTRGDDATLVRVLEAKLAQLGDSPEAAKTLGELARVLIDRLGRPEQALSVRLRALALDPRSAALHDAALTLSRTLGALDRYVDATTSLANAAADGGDVSLACALLVRLGAVSENDLGDARRAAGLYERAVDLGLRSAEVLQSLDRLFEKLGEADKQAKVLTMRVEVEAATGGKGAASDAVYRLAELRLGARATFDEGVEMLQTALDLAPDLDRARTILERAVAIDATHPALIELYERVGRHPGQERALVEALRLRSELPGSSADTVREAVAIATSIGESALARSLLSRFVDTRMASPSNQNAADLAWALGTLAELSEAAGELRKAVELKREAARMSPPDEARRLLFEVASMAAERLEDPSLAAEVYESLRATDPADREAWEPLLRVYRRMGAHKKLVELLGKVIDYVDDASERAKLRFERVKIKAEEGGDDAADAAPELREIVDEDPGLVDAALMLASILERTGQTEELIELLSRQLDAARDRGDAPAVASLALRLGGLVEAGDRGRARDAYYTGLDWEPKNQGLLDALLRLLESETDADSGEVADVLERRLAAEDGPRAQEMAKALHAKRVELGDEAAAQRALEVGFRAYPASTTLREQLEEGYRARSDWRKLAELYVVDASGRTDLSARIARLREAATVYRGRLADPRAAANALGQVLAAAPDDRQLLTEYVDALEEAGDHEAAATELGKALEPLAKDDPGRPALLMKRAAVRATGGLLAGALEDLEQAFEQEREKSAPALAAMLVAAEGAADGDAERVRLLRLRRAQVLPYAGDVETPRAILGALLASDARDREALRTLAGLESALEQWDAASAALRKLLGLEEGAASVEVALALADACERGGRMGDARAALERARAAVPLDAAVRQRLAQLYEQMGAFHELADLVLEEAGAAGDVAVRFGLLVRAGVVLLEQAGDPDASVAALEQARALRPGDSDCVGPLAEAYTLCGRGPDAIALLESILGPTKGKRSRELAPLYWRLSRVLQHGGDSVGEQRALVTALECDSQNGDVCAAVAIRAMETEQLELATRALRAVTLLKTPGPMSKGLAYQYMGEISIKQGDSKKALTLLKRACAEDPSLESAKELLQQIERGS
jgi:tetratricopeptide (TPR) repeat protein